MTRGNFYFISDDFFEKYNTNGTLMKNKEGLHARPCFYAFPDPKFPNIMWCVPISSQVEKYEKIVRHKLQRQIEKGMKSPICNTIVFGNVMGQRRAFLIQNMFPVTKQYIENIYIDRNTQNPVTIPSHEERIIKKYAKDVLKAVFHGHSFLVFTDIQNIYEKLSAELLCEQEDELEYEDYDVEEDEWER